MTDFVLDASDFFFFSSSFAFSSEGWNWMNIIQEVIHFDALAFCRYIAHFLHFTMCCFRSCSLLSLILCFVIFVHVFFVSFLNYCFFLIYFHLLIDCFSAYSLW